MLIVAAPSNLGLRPLRPGHEPGTWRAPAALLAAGLAEAIGASGLRELPRPAYSGEPQRGTRLYNGFALRAFDLALADEVERAQAAGSFPFVIGGDCSILLGALAGAKRLGDLGLVHVDGHSDFRHSGNDARAPQPNAAAGMDLALATGRGEALLTTWPGVTSPLVAEARIVQLGERESREAEYAYPDIADTEIARIDVFEAARLGPAAVIARIRRELALDRDGERFWLHFDVDVLDRLVMPAVDSPGSPGLPPDDVVAIASALLDASGCCGMTVTVFDPDLDPDGRYAAYLVALLGRIVRGATRNGAFLQ